MRLSTLVTVFLAFLGLSRLVGAEEVRVHGLTLVPWATKVDEDRYRSSKDFKDTVKYYDKMFGGATNIKHLNEVNVPGVRYVHFRNSSVKSKWSGFNIYQLGPQAEVRIFVLKNKAFEEKETVRDKAKSNAGKNKKEGATSR
jgi:hypothetical protein